MLTALWDRVIALIRSGRWPAKRRAHLAQEGECQCCGRTKELEVHHMLPVHVGGPELDDTNLITLCHDCHFVVGHGCDWKAWRKDCRMVSEYLRKTKVTHV